MRSFIASVLLVLSFGFSAQAATTPLAISIFPPVQFPPAKWTVTGVRLNLLWGQHQNVYGIDLGLVNSSERFRGLALAGVMNHTKGENYIGGGQIAGLMNWNGGKSKIVGVQFAALANYNKGESTVSGLQVALANIAEHSNIYGVQLGLYNEAKSIRGFQIGLVNRTKNLTGIQIGLINFYHNGLFKVSPILNAGF